MTKRTFYIILIYTFIIQACTNTVIDTAVENSFPIRSVSPIDTNFDDLQFLIDRLKDKKIVLLGEAAHGDGSAFEAKSRLVKFLHEELNYNVIAFEGATMYAMNQADKQIKNNKSFNVSSSELRKALYTSWSASKEFQELTKYITSNADSLAIVGIDNNYATSQYMRSFPEFLNNTLDLDQSSLVDFKLFKKEYMTMLTKYNPQQKKQLFSFKKLLSNIDTIKRIAHGSRAISENMKADITHELDNMTSYVKGLQMGLMASVTPRDRQMSENMSWLIDYYFPNEKIVIWTANFHAAKNLDQAIYKPGNDLYQRHTTLAQHLSAKYGDSKVYSIATTSVEGVTGGYPKPMTIDIPESSWEFEMTKEIEDELFYVDFDAMQNSCFGNDQFESTILGYKPHQGKWFNIFDGILFIREMKKSNY